MHSLVHQIFRSLLLANKVMIKILDYDNHKLFALGCIKTSEIRDKGYLKNCITLIIARPILKLLNLFS